MKLIEQPPYSPELNPSERVFEEIRRKVEGKVYGNKHGEKKAAIERELQQLAADPEKVKSLAGWTWIQQTVDSLSNPLMALHWAIGITWYSGEGLPRLLQAGQADRPVSDRPGPPRRGSGQTGRGIGLELQYWAIVVATACSAGGEAVASPSVSTTNVQD